MAESPKPKLLPQYVGAIIVTLGGLSMGTVIGWSSPASGMIKDQLPKEKHQNWISSVMPLGCAVSTLCSGYLMDGIGRKWTIIAVSIIVTLSYVMLMFSSSVIMYIVARLISGLSAGTYCVVCPTYVSEFAHKDVRGGLGVLFQFQIVIGILFAYMLGELSSMWALNIPFAAIPIVLCLLVFFLPESPVHLLNKDKEEAAKKSLVHFRGPNYPLDDEMVDLKDFIKKPDVAKWQIMKQKSTIKAFGMLLFLHLLQQLSGINAIIFFAKPVFESVSKNVHPGLMSVVLGLVQLVATGVSVALVDKAGRRLMFMISLSIMAVTTLFVGLHFLLVELKSSASKITGYATIGMINIYLVGFSLGTGPLPWLMLGELLPNSMKLLVSIAAAMNWFMAFVVTNTFEPLVNLVGAAVVFWIFCGFCVAGFCFVLFVLIETKGKSLEDIQKELSADAK